jgi:hypothetical protein
MKSGLREPVTPCRAQSIALIDYGSDYDRLHEQGTHAGIRTGKARWQ